ncbi:MAG: insulinase family protein [Proteobacteria bacterium]|nr:insulinase family protein [Pseudomonadota bacterium]
MAVNFKLTTQQLKWLKIVMSAFVVIAIILIAINRYTKSDENQTTQEFDNMLGIKGNRVEDLKNYQTIEGVLNIQHWLTDTGVKVYFVPVKTIPMVDIEVIFDAGAARDENKGGLAYLTNALLADGTAQLTADQVAANFDNVGALFQAESQRDMAVIHLRSLSDPKQFLPAVKTLEAILTQPSFPESGFKREQQKALSALKQQAQRPQQVASRAFYSLLYQGQPYANWVLGDEASINALTVADLRAFYEKYYVAENTTVAIVGDLSTQEADAIAQALTNQLPKGKAANLLPLVQDLKEGTLKKIAFPSAQTTILMGQPGIKRGDPDYYPLMVGNHILGGNGSVTRIFDIIRNQHGLAYSAYSYFIPMHERGPFVLGCQTRNDQADKARNLMATLVKDFVDNGPSDKELEQAKQNLLGGYVLQFDSNASICHEIGALGFYNLPLDYFNQYKMEVNKITNEDIKAAFRKHIIPENMAVVMVGGEETNKEKDKEKVEKKDAPPKQDIHQDLESAPRGAEG